MNWYKRSSNETYVYHVSPEAHLQFFRARGKKSGVQAIPQYEEGIYVAPTFKDSVSWFVSFVAYKKDQKGGIGQHYKNATIYTISIPKEIKDKLWKNNSWENEFFIPKQYIKDIKIVSRQNFTFDELMKISRRHTSIENETRRLDYNKEALKLKNNIAAQEYLRLKKEFSDRKLKGQKYWKINEEAIRELFKRLENHFSEFSYENMTNTPLEVVRDEQKTNKIINELKMRIEHSSYGIF